MNRLMTETLLRWTLNGQPQKTLLCSPGQERALLTGLLLTEGLGPARSLRLEAGVWQAETEDPAAAFADLPERLARVAPVTGQCALSGAELLACQRSLLTAGGKSGLHGALVTDGARQAVGRDVGRHNAIDKAVGQAAALGVDFSRAALCASGRLSLEMLAKAAAVGIPALCTAKQVGSLCAEHARRLGITILQIEKAGEKP